MLSIFPLFTKFERHELKILSLLLVFLLEIKTSLNSEAPDTTERQLLPECIAFLKDVSKEYRQQFENIFITMTNNHTAMEISKVCEGIATAFSEIKANSSKQVNEINTNSSKQASEMRAEATTEAISAINTYIAENFGLLFQYAMGLMRTLPNYCYHFFGLDVLKLSQSELTLEYPPNFQDMMNVSDTGVFTNKTGQVVGYFSDTKPMTMKKSYVKWNKLVNLEWISPKKEIAKKLNTELDEYYQASRIKPENQNNSNYASNADFYKYFAATISRTYKLGCLHGNHLSVLLVQYTDTTSLSDVLLKHMPNWYLTEEHLDLINILARLANYTGEFLVGKRIKNVQGKEVIIPIYWYDRQSKNVTSQLMHDTNFA